MFWRFGGYANISTIDTILDKQDFSTEDLLDEGDLIQELKQHNAKLIEYLRQDHVLQRLLQYVVAPKLEPVAPPDQQQQQQQQQQQLQGQQQDQQSGDEDRGSGSLGGGKSRLLPFSRPRASPRSAVESEEEEAEKKRNRYAYVSAEVLSSDTWSIYEALMENQALIRDFWTFLRRDTPLDPLQASYFTKVNEALFEKKTEDMVRLLMGMPGSVQDLLRHVECPMIMDLLLKIIAMDRSDGGQGIVEWLYSQDLMPTLVSFLGPEHSWVVQTAAGEFIKAIITISANATQNEQQCIGPNELTRQLVSRGCVEQLIGYMLGGGNALTVGVGIVIEVIRKNNSDYDPDVGAEANLQPSSRDPIYLGTLLRLFARRVPDFVALVRDAPAQKLRLDSTSGEKIEPLGFDRFKTCELMAELLHCSNMGLLNEVGSEELIAARDAERQRLRAQGKLSPGRTEEAPEDATQTAPAEEARRLEVTNVADDDGFEEVEHSREMSEDTSHEFVKAEDEIPLPKDEFVDEPLNSPKDKFEMPELVVAPLSPRKKKSEPAVDDEASKEGAVESEKPASEAKQGEETKVETPEIESKEAVVQDTPAAEAADPVKESDEKSAAGADASPEEADPANAAAGSEPEIAARPEDTPAPLFSTPGLSRSPDDDETMALPDYSAAGDAVEDTQPLTVVIPSPPAPRPAELAPVVGDFLKMQFVEYRVVPTILSFFFAYPWNNFLHNVVYDIVQQVFNGPMDRGYNPTLAVSLFEAADITAAIVRGQAASDESQARTRTRMGYMGHLTLIAEEVVKFTERHPPEMLSETVLDRVMSADWINYVEGSLAETRERDNAILGGVRPEVALGHRAAGVGGGGGLAAVGLSGLGSASSQGGSNALAEAGLNGGIEPGEGSGGGGGGGIGPFAISSGTMISGFGSSSDEEDEDGEDNDEDVNSEFRAYTDPLNNSSSFAPPSLPPPPPPPPLNTPPSRARLQLSQRLAMRKKNHDAQAAAQAASAENGDGARHELDHEAANPFGDDEEVDDVDSDEGEGLDDHGAGHGDRWAASAAGRGSWWRDVVRRRGGERDEDEDSDDDGGRDAIRDRNRDDDDDDDDEEFGDFAMPEVEHAPQPPQGDSIIKPLAVHPHSHQGFGGLGGQGLAGGLAGPGLGQKSAFGGLWPFSAQGFGQIGGREENGERKEREDDDGEGEGEVVQKESCVMDKDGKEVKARDGEGKGRVDDGGVDGDEEVGVVV